MHVLCAVLFLAALPSICIAIVSVTDLDCFHEYRFCMPLIWIILYMTSPVFGLLFCLIVFVFVLLVQASRPSELYLVFDYDFDCCFVLL